MTWEPEANILRVNPSFHGKVRNDYALVHFDAGVCYIAQLLFIFGIHIGNKVAYMALVLPIDRPPTHRNQRRDRDLRFTRLRSRTRNAAGTRVISLESIIRGCLIVPDFASNSHDEYFLVPFIDQDMWLRMKGLALGNNLGI